MQRLVGQLLIPRGLVLNGDGTAVPTKTAGNALSRINIRTKEIPPEAIAPVANVLRWLYWPPVLVTVLLAAAGVEIWLYFIHGIASGLRDAIYRPGLMLLMLLFIVLAAAFHELGHAAALHYSGQKVRGMGAGLYLVYPAFYTDVTNNYRLPRWQRVRTDLGGFYFNLIFALAVVGAYALTGQDWLLLVVLLINFEIVHQLLPFLRLDGYWTLADMTGVPDFLSQMGAFVRSIVPGMRSDGQKLPPLKWWGKLIFGAYIVFALPLMGVLIFVMVKAAPRAFATAWDSFNKQAQAFAQAQTHGDILGIVSSAGQILLLAIPTLGLAYTLFLLARRLFGAIWRWSAPSWPRRIAGTVGSAAIAILLVWLWAPQLPSLTGGKPATGVAFAAANSNFVPISQSDHGTVSEAVTEFPVVPSPAAEQGPNNRPTNSPASASTAARPAGTVNPSSSASGAAQATAVGSQTPAPANGSSAPSAQPTSSPAGGVQTYPVYPATPAPSAAVPGSAPVYASAAPASAPAVTQQQSTRASSPAPASPATSATAAAAGTASAITPTATP
ncbi:MAG: hypothetical protein JOZ39_10195 [Chloroflexi bacterium]|nr:hypothetical protein [Chloroflexota bacterium]